MNDLDHLIRQFDGAGSFEYEPDPECRYPGLIILGLCIIAWAAFFGAGYAIYQAVEAVTGA